MSLNIAPSWLRLHDNAIYLIQHCWRLFGLNDNFYSADGAEITTPGGNDGVEIIPLCLLHWLSYFYSFRKIFTTSGISCIFLLSLWDSF